MDFSKHRLLSDSPTVLTPRLSGRLITVLFICMALIVAALIGGMATIVADDYCQAAGVASQGVLGMLQSHYLHWSGRFSQNLVTSLSFWAMGDRAPQIAPALLLLALIAALAFALRPHTREPLLIAALAGLLYVAALGAFVWQAFYWMVGGQTYITPLVCGALLWGLIDQRHNKLLILLVAFLASGFHETSAVVIGAVLMIGLVRRSPVRVTIALTGLALGAIVVLLAPGNAVRDAMLPPPIPMTDAAIRALAGTIANLIRMITQTPLVVVALVVFGVAVGSTEDVRPRLLLLGILIGIGFSILSLLPAAWRMGNISPARFYALSTGMLCVGWVLIGAGLSRPNWRWGYRTALVAVALVALISMGQIANAGVAQTGGFAQLAGLDTPESETWIQACAVEWERVR